MEGDREHAEDRLHAQLRQAHADVVVLGQAVDVERLVARGAHQRQQRLAREAGADARRGHHARDALAHHHLLGVALGELVHVGAGDQLVPLALQRGHRQLDHVLARQQVVEELQLQRVQHVLAVVQHDAGELDAVLALVLEDRRDHRSSGSRPCWSARGAAPPRAAPAGSAWPCARPRRWSAGRWGRCRRRRGSCGTPAPPPCSATMAAMTSLSCQAGTMIASGCSSRSRSCSTRERAGTAGCARRRARRKIRRVQYQASMNRSSSEETKMTSARIAASTSRPELYSASIRSQVIIAHLLSDVSVARARCHRSPAHCALRRRMRLANTSRPTNRATSTSGSSHQ